jgi:hypothetical protein
VAADSNSASATFFSDSSCKVPLFPLTLGPVPKGSPLAPSCVPFQGTVPGTTVYVSAFAVDCFTTPGSATDGVMSESAPPPPYLLFLVLPLLLLQQLLLLVPSTHANLPLPPPPVVAFLVILSVGLAALIVYWIWQDKKNAKKEKDTSGTVDHYKRLDDEAAVRTGASINVH